MFLRTYIEAKQTITLLNNRLEESVWSQGLKDIEDFDYKATELLEESLNLTLHEHKIFEYLISSQTFEDFNKMPVSVQTEVINFIAKTIKELQQLPPLKCP